MNKFYILSLMSLLITVSPAFAEDLFGLDGDDDMFALSSSSSQEPTENKAPLISSFLSNRIPESTAKNINKAEKVFCYVVDYAAAGFEGYTIHNLALKGSCGELSQAGKNLVKNSIFENNSLYSNSKDNCNISPKIILRYINGADYTDVLFSSPCQSLTFFHDSDITTINAAPGAAIIDQIVKAYSSLSEPYQSPALLGQMVANGQALNQRDKEVLRKMAPSEAPIKKWNTQQPAPQQAPAQNKQPARSGWNKLRQ
ncbi:MAG: hypothetical protein IJ532_02250 [Alphaproteobacteria bacterium]|nr:hypothetical protein [Alphaproteobacteria bacterium]